MVPRMKELDKTTAFYILNIHCFPYNGSILTFQMSTAEVHSIYFFNNYISSRFLTDYARNISVPNFRDFTKLA